MPLPCLIFEKEQLSDFCSENMQGPGIFHGRDMDFEGYRVDRSKLSVSALEVQNTHGRLEVT